MKVISGSYDFTPEQALSMIMTLRGTPDGMWWKKAIKLNSGAMRIDLMERNPHSGDELHTEYQLYNGCIYSKQGHTRKLIGTYATTIHLI